MRIAVSGTHFIGKTTLIDDFIAKHSDYTKEDEAYQKLADSYQVNPEAGPSFELAKEQLLVNLEHIFENIDQDNIIYDRCPIDFLVYAACALAQEQNLLAESELSDMFDDIIEALASFDLIVFLPLNENQEIEYTQENPQLRIEADHYFQQIYRDDEFKLFPTYNQPRIIEVFGTREERVKLIESYL